MQKFVFVVVAALIANVGYACSCMPPLNNESSGRAKNIFVFRLVSAELQTENSDNPVTTVVVGKINVVENVRGVTKATRFAYSTLWCCGIRVDVGKYYAAFVQEDDSIQFFGNNANLLELGEAYDAQSMGAKLKRVANGTERLESGFSESQIDRTQQVPRPPDPCPKVVRKATH